MTKVLFRKIDGSFYSNDLGNSLSTEMEALISEVVYNLSNVFFFILYIVFTTNVYCGR